MKKPGHSGNLMSQATFPGRMRQEPDTPLERNVLDEADRACRELGGQIEQARVRLLREYRDILRKRSARKDVD